MVGDFTLIDGGLSTAIEEVGGDVSGRLWTAALAVTDPELLVAAHRAFVEAGSEIITTASYQCDGNAFTSLGTTAREGRRILAGMTGLARRACEGTPTRVAASVGPFGASLADGSEYSGAYGVDWSVVESYHREKLEILVSSGPDIVAVETIPLAVEAKLIADLLVELGAPPAWFGFGCVSTERTYGGDSLAVAARGVSDYPNLVALGVNCLSPANVGGALCTIGREVGDRPLIAYPNHGRSWDSSSRRWVGTESIFDSEESIGEWSALGARFIGGCCGVGPTTIARVARHRHRPTR